MNWAKKYLWIVEYLNLDSDGDYRASEVLDLLLAESGVDIKSNLRRLESFLKNRSVLVYGAGPSLEKDVKEIKKFRLNGRCVSVAADGAVKKLLEEGIVPEVDVTDLDGDVKSIIEANKRGTLTVIHAHGDNIPLVREYVPRLVGGLVGTTQNKPFGNVINFGGFTDGDRCVFMADYFKAKTIVLLGMDFGKTIGKYSGKCKDPKRKIKKLEVGRGLIWALAKESHSLILNATSGGENIDNVPRISIPDLSMII